MRLRGALAVVFLAGCAGGDDPTPPGPAGPARIVVTVLERGSRSDETFALENARLTPSELEEPYVYGRAGDEEPEEGITFEEIYLRPPDGRARQLTDDRRGDLAPQLLDDGRVAFLSCVFSTDGSSPSCTLDAIDPSSGERTTLLDDLGIAFDGELSPDESRFLFTRLEESGVPAGLFVRDLKGGEARRVVDGTGGTWSPDGARIAFVSDRDENGRCLFHDCLGYAGEIYVAGADGSDEERLTVNPQVDGRPEWSGDGEWIVFPRIPDEEDDWDLHAVRADGACERQLTNTTRWEVAAEWHGGGHGGLSC